MMKGVSSCDNTVIGREMTVGERGQQRWTNVVLCQKWVEYANELVRLDRGDEVYRYDLVVQFGLL